MTTRFLALRDAVVAALQQAPAVAGGRIRAGREVPVPAEHASAVDVHLAAARGQSQVLVGDDVLWDVDIGIDLYARAATGADAEAAIDPLLEAAYTRLAAATPPAGVSRWVLDAALQWRVAEHDTTLITVPLTLRVQCTAGNTLA